MSCLAVLFALTEKEVEKLRAVPRKKRFDYMYEEIEKTYFERYPDYKQELDKSWDAMHRMLTNGKLYFGTGRYSPFCDVILGGEVLYGDRDGEEDGILSLKTPEQAAQIADMLPRKTKKQCRQVYYSIDENEYGFPLSDEDFEYTWEWMQASMDFWKRASAEKRYVLFTADQ